MLKLAGFNSTIYSFNKKTGVSFTPSTRCGVTEKRCILKIIMSEGGIEKDSAKNEGTDGCYRQVQVVFQLEGAC